MEQRMFGKPLINPVDLQRRIRKLGHQISQDYVGKDLVLVGLLKGAFAFYADLARAISIPLAVDFLVVTSGGSSTEGKKRVKMISDLTVDIAGRDVLLVEDIVDSGLTVKSLMNRLQARKPASLKICAMLDKPSRRKVDVKLDYVGFMIPNKYVIGFGLDYKNNYRNLPYLAVLDQLQNE
ncbi:MAG: hypoxanthine phosphoribosyltransferase [Nitrospirae bacterium]|nr:hypoxanthine phosphoribosyltransferase [Nitrospirota bacterium]